MEIQRIDPFLDYFERVRERTRRVILCIPPEHLEWTHKPGAFTFGDLMRHLGAIERHMFAENACGRPSRYPGHGRELADGWEATLAYFDGMHQESLEIFRGLTSRGSRAPLRDSRRRGDRRLEVAALMVEHEIHHRGQIYLMLGILDVPTPPLYGLTSEEVQARSTSEPKP